jgi:6-phosphogluconolactonase
MYGIPITDSPKPPPSRITLTIPVLNGAKRVAVISTGASKADTVRGYLNPAADAGKEPLPTGRARPTNGELHWFMDEGAASKL